MGALGDAFMAMQKKVDSGLTPDEAAAELYKEHEKIGRKNAKQEGKTWGECESCSYETCLDDTVNMCGPCTFGESATVNGNW